MFILNYIYGLLPKSKLSRELAKQAVITKCRGISMRSQAVSLKAVDFRANIKSVIIQ